MGKTSNKKPRKSDKNIKDNETETYNNVNRKNDQTCNICNQIIDGIILKSHILDGLNICNYCYDIYTKTNNNEIRTEFNEEHNKSSKINLFTNPPIIPTPLFTFSQPNILLPPYNPFQNIIIGVKPKNENTKNNPNTNTTTKCVNKSGNKGSNKSGNKGGNKGDKNIDDKDKKEINSKKTSKDPFSSSLFLQSVLNRLNNIDNPSNNIPNCPPCCSNDDDDNYYSYNYDEDTENENDDEEDNVDNLEYEWLGDNIKNN